MQKLAMTCERYETRVIAFVLMTNHYHLLLDTPRANLGEAMNYFQREASKSVGRMLRRRNHLFGGSYRGCLFEQTSHLWNGYKYVYRNPVKAGLCKRVEDYPFSTLYYLVRGIPLPFTLHDDLALKMSPIPHDMSDRLQWLNNDYSQDAHKAIQRGLRRSTFALATKKLRSPARRELAVPERLPER